MPKRDMTRYDSTKTKLHSFYNRYRDLLQFNKNLIISGAVAFFVSAAVTQLYAQYSDSDIANSIITVLSGYAVSIPIFAILFHMDNKHKYTDEATGRTNYVILKYMLNRLIAVRSISDIGYISARLIVLYQLLQIAIEPYQASMISAISASAISYLLMNVSAKGLRLFKFSNRS